MSHQHYRMLILLLVLLPLLHALPTAVIPSTGTGMSTSSLLKDKLIGSMIGFYAGDALSMPVHWYYDLSVLHEHWGEAGITKYEKPKMYLPGSIMNLSNTGGGGRGSDKGSIIGDVINHGKKQYWIRGGDYNYHHTLNAGENTLDALVTRILAKSLIKTNGVLDVNDFRQSYIAFMTTPGSHNDTYAGTCHRMFFKNYIDKKSPEKCPDNDGHNVDAIDALMTVPVTTIAMLEKDRDTRLEAVKNAIQATRRTTAVLKCAYVYSDMLSMIIKDNVPLRDIAGAAGMELGIDLVKETKMSRRDPMTACYIDSAFPAMLYFAFKYGHNPEECLLKSTNAGGENVARTSLLGALLGASVGYSQFPAHFKNGLTLGSEYYQEAAQLADVVSK